LNRSLARRRLTYYVLQKMIAVDKYPSFWSGIAAAQYPFADVSDYSSWACGLIESGHDTENVCVLAGLFDEDNRFEIDHWHRMALRDLGYSDLSERAALIAHLRGCAEELLAGRRDFKELNRHFAEINRNEDEELLEPFVSLHYGYWDFEYVDMSDMGITSLDDFPKACAEACTDLVNKIQAEQAGTGQPATRPLSDSEGSDNTQPEAEGRSR
jgi:hypothetical protein